MLTSSGVVSLVCVVTYCFKAKHIKDFTALEKKSKGGILFSSTQFDCPKPDTLC